MIHVNWISLFLFFGLLLAATPILGYFFSQIVQGRTKFFGWDALAVENRVYRLLGIDAHEEMGWKKYLKALLLFNIAGWAFFFLILLLQGILPLNPQQFDNVPWPLAFNIASSFVTNTNWQAYAGETTLSNFSQMAGCTVQNFLSAATGFCALAALIRGLTRKESLTIGNFWTDLTKCLLYILLPLSIGLALLLTFEGTVQTLQPYLTIQTLEGEKQALPLGPVASQSAIKQLGSNGGGFYNVNSAHPFENPTPLTNFAELLAILLIPAALPYMFGQLVGMKNQGWTLFFVMFGLWGLSTLLMLLISYQPSPLYGTIPLEGIETRIGITNSAVWASATTATSNGSVNAMHSSFSPLAGGIALMNMLLGEVIFGGVGVGLCSMLFFVFFTVFLAGLMVGRTPEYLGKKIERREIKWVMAGIIIPSAAILIGTSFATIHPEALKSLSQAGPHGLTELLYAFASPAANNGSSFAGFNSDTFFYNLSLGAIMLACRCAILIPALAIAGSLAQKNISPRNKGTFNTETVLFGVLLAVVILLIGTLTFFPALVLGPIVEHFLMINKVLIP